MAKAKRVIWCTSLHGLYIKLFLSMKTLHQKSPTALVKRHNSAIEANVGRVIVWSTQLVHFRCSPCLQTKAIPSCTMTVTISQLPIQLPMIQLPKTAVPSSRGPEESPATATPQKRVCISYQNCNCWHGLWDDARIIPCDSQLWAIQCTWSI